MDVHVANTGVSFAITCMTRRWCTEGCPTEIAALLQKKSQFAKPCMSEPTNRVESITLGVLSVICIIYFYI